jgi:hypothetical protein
MRLARHLELAVHPAQKVSCATLAQAMAHALHDPRMGIPSLPDLPASSRVINSVTTAPRTVGPLALRPFSAERGRDASRQQHFAIGEDRLAADLRHPRDLCNRQLVLRDQPHHQSPTGSRFLRLGLRRVDFVHQLLA